MNTLQSYMNNWSIIILVAPFERDFEEGFNFIHYFGEILNGRWTIGTIRRNIQSIETSVYFKHKFLYTNQWLYWPSFKLMFTEGFNLNSTKWDIWN